MIPGTVPDEIVEVEVEGVRWELAHAFPNMEPEARRVIIEISRSYSLSFLINSVSRSSESQSYLTSSPNARRPQNQSCGSCARTNSALLCCACRPIYVGNRRISLAFARFKPVYGSRSLLSPACFQLFPGVRAMPLAVEL